MAQSKYINEQGLAKIFALIAGKYETIATVADLTALVGAAAKDNEEAKSILTRVSELETAVGSDVAKQIADAIDALAGSATSTDGDFVTVTVTTENGEVKSVSVAEEDIASAQDLSDLSDLVGTAADGKDAETVFGAIAAEADRADTAEKANAKAIADEATAARNAEQDLSNRIGAAAVVEGETTVTAASGVYAYVDTQVAAVNGAAETLEETLTGLVTAEETRAKAAEQANADAIDDIKDGTTIDSFADVESALALKADDADLTALETRVGTAETAIDNLESGKVDRTQKIAGLAYGTGDISVTDLQGAIGLEDLAYADTASGNVEIPAQEITGVKATGDIEGSASVTLTDETANATVTYNDYTPEGTINVTLKNNTVSEITSVGTLPTKAADSWTANVPTAIDTTKFNGGEAASISDGFVTAGSDAVLSEGAQAELSTSEISYVQEGVKVEVGTGTDNETLIFTAVTAQTAKAVNVDTSVHAQTESTFFSTVKTPDTVTVSA